MNFDMIEIEMGRCGIVVWMGVWDVKGDGWVVYIEIGLIVLCLLLWDDIG